MSREELLRLPKDYVLELLGIDISATRMKCAMLGLKIVKSAALGQPAEWEDEGEAGSPAPKRRPSSADRPDRSDQLAGWADHGEDAGVGVRLGDHGEAAGGDVDRAEADLSPGRLHLLHRGVGVRDAEVDEPVGRDLGREHPGDVHHPADRSVAVEQPLDVDRPGLGRPRCAGCSCSATVQPKTVAVEGLGRPRRRGCRARSSRARRRSLTRVAPTNVPGCQIAEDGAGRVA